MSRFVWSNLEGYTRRTDPDPAALDLPSRWILSRLHGLIANVQRLFDTFQYAEAGRQILDFLWGEFGRLVRRNQQKRALAKTAKRGAASPHRSMC